MDQRTTGDIPHDLAPALVERLPALLREGATLLAARYPDCAWFVASLRGYVQERADTAQARDRQCEELAALLLPDRSDSTAIRDRLSTTLGSWRQHLGDRPVAQVHVHQTVRHRLTQLREPFGPALGDPASRRALLSAHVRGGDDHGARAE
jgi:hypothetical protein